MAKQRERGQGGLLKVNGCRFWYAQWYVDGKQKRVSTRTAVKQEAEAVLRRLMGDSERGLTPVSELRKIRYGDLRRALLDNYVERGNKSLQVLADGSETIWGLRQLDEFFEYKGAAEPGVPVTRMTSDAAREFVRKRQAEGVGNAAINRSLSALRRMLRIAYEDGKIQFVPKIHLLKEPPPRKGFLPREKFERLLAGLPDALKPLVVFLYYCGVRLGEALQITWPQVDLKAGLIRLEDEQTKTGEARVVPLPDTLLAMLAPVEPKEGPVFTSTNLRKAWQKAAVAAGLGRFIEVPGKPYDPRYEGLIIHDLRRSAIKNLVDAGAHETTAMSISGHRTRSVFDRYAIRDAADKIRAMRRVENLVTNGERTVKALPPARPTKRQRVDSKRTAVSSRG